MLNLLQHFKTEKKKKKIYNYGLWPPKMIISYFHFILEHNLKKGAFKLSNYHNWINVDMLTKTNQSLILQDFMNKYNFKLTFKKKSH
jgi:hypothetical protein